MLAKEQEENDYKQNLFDYYQINGEFKKIISDFDTT